MKIRNGILQEGFATEFHIALVRAAMVAFACAAIFILPAQSLADSPFQYKQDGSANGASPFPSLEQIFRDNAYVPTALMQAAVANDPHPEEVLSLLRQGAKVNEKDNLGRTALVWAVKPPKLVVVDWSKANEKVIKYLLAFGANPNAKDESGETVLIDSIGYGDATVVKALPEHGADVNAVPDGGDSALMDSVPHPKVFRLLLAHGAHINFRGPDGVTTLDRAVAFGDPEVVRILLMHHPHITEADAGELFRETIYNDGIPAAIDVDNSSHISTITNLLLLHGLDADARSQGRTPLLWCASIPQSDIATARLLIAYRAKVNARDEEGRTPLIWATSNGNSDLVKLLLTHGAEVNARSNRGRSALDVAPDSSIANILKQAGAK